MLKLPSGRTLSDYRNFDHPKSGWQSKHLQNMLNRFKSAKISNYGKLGMLVFDEVKIKEGLVFDPSTWELIGFTDLGSDKDIENLDSFFETPKKEPLKKKQATHVMQFFFKSLFANVDFPCAYFLTRGLTGIHLNRIFWQGVSLLHGFGFEVLLSCDGASENRKFIRMNTHQGSLCKGYNRFSKNPLFFLSDPPHLLKKLRNNLFNIGDKTQNSQFTRKLTRGGQNIIWKNIEDVDERDKKRHCFVTPLRRSHINLDSVSKMKVKLAVEVLSPQICVEMQQQDSLNTVECQKYTENCDKIWKVFNDKKKLAHPGDPRTTALDDVLEYFTSWKTEIGQQFRTKTEQSQHFITWQTFYDLQV